MNYMIEALKLLNDCDKKEIPVSAVIVKDGKIISTAVNSKEKDIDVTSHAEIIAISL